MKKLLVIVLFFVSYLLIVQRFMIIEVLGTWLGINVDYFVMNPFVIYIPLGVHLVLLVFKGSKYMAGSILEITFTHLAVMIVISFLAGMLEGGNTVAHVWQNFDGFGAYDISQFISHGIYFFSWAIFCHLLKKKFPKF